MEMGRPLYSAARLLVRLTTHSNVSGIRPLAQAEGRLNQRDERRGVNAQEEDGAG